MIEVVIFVTLVVSVGVSGWWVILYVKPLVQHLHTHDFLYFSGKAKAENVRMDFISVSNEFI